ncbi:MAG: outer membrane protein assembly factor BamD [Bacteroidota bacterium]|nr:outer membrane protein assembly factor BamD [Bacteroidota bacterium]
MKRSLSFILLIFTAFFCNSCSFSKLLKSNDADAKYEKAIELYEHKDYSRALQLFDQLIGTARATDKSERIYYLYAYCYYNQKDYTMASYYFKRYATNFPNTKNAEECQYLSAYCTYLDSPDYSLDQSNSTEAIKDLQLFVNNYPTSSHVPDCNDLIDKLRNKLAEKDFKLARLYFRMDDYMAAIVSFNNILKEYPETDYREESLFLILKSSCKYAEKSIESKKKERDLKAVSAYNDFMSQYPKSKFVQEAKDLKEKVDKDLASIAAGKNTTIKKNQNKLIK